METVKKFYEALQADKAMQERANQVNEQYKWADPAATDQKVDIKAIVAFAKGEGYDFTATELEAYQKGMRALGDDELDVVSGGVFDGDSCDCSLSGFGRDPRACGGECTCNFGGSGSGGMCQCVLGGDGF